MKSPMLVGSAMLADFGGIGVLVLVAFLVGCVVFSVGVAVFDRRLAQFVLAATSCLLFGLFCIMFVLAVLGVTQADHYPPFGLMIPPIIVIQLILSAVRLFRSSRRHRERTRII